MKLELGVEPPEITEVPIVTRISCGDSHVFVRSWNSPAGYVIATSDSSVANIRMRMGGDKPGWTYGQALARARALVRVDETRRLLHAALSAQLTALDKEIPS